MNQSFDIQHDVLNNSQRPYFGLDPIDPAWDAAEIKPGVIVFFDGDVIKKVILHVERRDHIEHREFDTAISTRNRQAILPKTDKGKEKKLNFSSVSTSTPSGCTFSLLFGSFCSLGVGNQQNAISLPLPGEHKFTKLEDFQQWRDAYIADSPPSHFAKVERMRNTPHRTIKYFNGDIFRFEIDREHYGFGLIIGQIRKMQKDGMIPKRHALNDTMCVPLLIRLYRVKTKDCDIPTEQIVSMPLLPAGIMADDCVLWGGIDIVGSKQLNADDIDFPIQVGRALTSERYFRLCWGIGMVFTEQIDDAPHFRGGDKNRLYHINRFLNNGVTIGIRTSSVESELRGESPRTAWSDICHPDNMDFKNAAFQFFQLPFDITFDEFNAKYDSMTRLQYADYANKYLRTELLQNVKMW